jgi:hypothetical protein
MGERKVLNKVPEHTSASTSEHAHFRAPLCGLGCWHVAFRSQRACCSARASVTLIPSWLQYYPPDFDPAKLPRGQRGNKDAQMKVGLHPHAAPQIA